MLGIDDSMAGRKQRVPKSMVHHVPSTAALRTSEFPCAVSTRKATSTGLPSSDTVQRTLCKPFG